MGLGAPPSNHGTNITLDMGAIVFRRALLLAAAIITAGACATEATDTPAAAVDASADEAKLRADAPVWFDHYNRGDADGVANLYADDAVLMAPGAPAAVGKEAIRSFIATDIPRTKAAALALNGGDITGVGVSGDLGWLTGTFTVTDSAGTTVDSGKYLSLFRRINSEWKLIRDIWNSDAAPAPSAPPAG